jgi:hypothetical protein
VTDLVDVHGAEIDTRRDLLPALIACAHLGYLWDPGNQAAVTFRSEPHRGRSGARVEAVAR